LASPGGLPLAYRPPPERSAPVGSPAYPGAMALAVADLYDPGGLEDRGMFLGVA